MTFAVNRKIIIDESVLPLKDSYIEIEFDVTQQKMDRLTDESFF